MSCPKCQSMVQIEAPSPSGPQVAVGNSSVDSEAITEEGISASGMHQPETAAPNEASAPFTSPPEILFPGNSTSKSEQATFQGPPPADAGPSPSGAVDPGEPVAWQSSKTRQIRQIALVAMLSIASLCVTAILFVWFVQSQSNKGTRNKNTVAQAEGPQIHSDNDPATTVTEAEPDDGNDAVSALPETETSDVPTEPATETTLQPNPSPPAEVANSADQVTKSNPAENAAVPINGNTNAGNDLIPSGLIPPSIIPEADLARNQTPIPDSLIPKSPLDGSDDNDGLSNPDGPEGITLDELPEGLQEYLNFLPKAGSTAQTTLKAPASIEQFQIDAAEQEDIFGLQPRRSLNLKADLAIRLAFQSEPLQLHDFVMLLSQITNIPIDIDWVAFDLAQRDLRKPIRPIKKRSAREWLEFVAEQIDGEIQTEEFLVKLTLAEAEFSEATGRLANLDDFGAGQDSAAEILEQFFDAPVNPDAAQTGQPVTEDSDAEVEDSQDGDTETPIDSREMTYLRVLATEVLRNMRGIENKLPLATLRRWTSFDENIAADWIEVSGGQWEAQIDTPIAMVGFFRRVAKQNNAACLINWPDVGQRGIQPGTLVLPPRQANAGAALADLLDDYSLQARQIDTEHWWIGTQAKYDRLPIVVASPVLGPSRESYLNQVKQIALSTGNQQARISYDPVSDRALMFLPRYLARQLTKLDWGIAKR